MIKYAKITNEQTGLCEVGIGTNAEFYQSIGMIELDVQQSDIDKAWYLTEKCPMKTDEQKAKEERDRIDALCLTRSDVERVIYADKGMDFDGLIEYVKTNIPAMDVKALKIELRANNFYRKHPYINQLGTVLGYTSDDLDYLFQNKALPEKVTKSEQPTEPTTEENSVAEENSESV
mgnify:CR=1 FL=1